MSTAVPSPGTNTVRDDVREVIRDVGIGLGAGVLTGYLLVGPLARLVMLLLRVTSSPVVIGVTSDDGFTIGRVSGATFALVFVCATLGGIAGVAYAFARIAVPHRGVRLTLWTSLCATLGGAVIIHDDGVDFVLLTPTWLAVGAFITLPALGGLIIALATDRISSIPSPGRRMRIAMPAAGLLAPLAAVPAAVAGGLMLVLGRFTAPAWLAGLARFSVIALALFLIALSLVDLAGDISALA